MRTTTMFAMAALVLAGTIAFAQNVSYDFDASTNFAALKTYAWVRGTPLTDEINHRRVVGAIEAQLALRGLTRLETSANADLLVAYHATFDRDLQINGFSSGWGGYRFAGNRTGSARTEQILVGTLGVDLINAKSKTIVWRAMATKDVDVNAKPEKREKNIDKTVEKLFKNYPPKQ